MKSLCMLLLCITVSVSVMAQNKYLSYEVSGQIVEKISGKGVPYATIVLQNDSIKVRKMHASDGSGKFFVILEAPDKYMLTVSSVGYKEFSMPVIVNGLKTGLGKLPMEEGVMMKEVTVTAQKPLVKIEVDKIVYNMEADLESQTNNVLEMLRKVPLITVDAEENITLNGQSDFKVLVNGKNSSMLSANLKEVLKSMPANTIKDIEVITNPSSKYEAEGVGGIINIITIKKTINGYNGSVSSGIDTRGGINGSVYLATKINKFSISSRYFGRQIKQPDSEAQTTSEYFYNENFHYSKSDADVSYTASGNGLMAEASYDIDTLNLISLSFWGYQTSYQYDGFIETQYLNITNDITRMYTTSANRKFRYGSISGNIDYQKSFKKPDKLLTFSYKLDNNPNTTKTYTDIIGLTNYTSYRQRSVNNAVGREQTLQADYYDPLTRVHQIEGGAKLILRQNASNSEIYYNDTEKLNNLNDLDYDQYILGIYAGYMLKWEKISAKAGFRLERTWNNGVSKTDGIDTDFKNRLFNPVPYITLSFMPQKGQTIKASYTQRLSRPGIWYLNPYVDNTDSMNISYGNPLLKAEISHSFEAGYASFKPKFNMSASAYVAFVNNSIERISRVQVSGATVTTYKNIGKDQRYGLNLYMSYRPSAKLNVNFNGGVNYAKLEADYDYTITNEGLSYRTTLGGRWTIFGNSSINMNAGIYTPGVTLQRKTSTYYYTSFGVTQYLLKRKLMLSVSVSDPFWYRKKNSYDTEDITFSSHNETSQLAQTLRFGLTYNFGKMKSEVKKASRSIKNDDLKNGSNNQEGIQ